MSVLASLVLLLISYEVGSTPVQVEQGLLEGEQLDLVTGDGKYFSFKGVPYAAPPVGGLRFKAPQPPSSWQGVRNATQHGSKCIQYDIVVTQSIVGSEDCLFLNVYTPDLAPTKPLPVMVFIHGGAVVGSGNVDQYGPDFIVQKGVVLVTMNYRLEVLGMLSLNTPDVPGNAAMKDQVAAMRWVQKNIRKFGGDPDNVTLFGESSGSASAILHIVSPMSKGLFKRVIAISGVPSNDWFLPFKPAKRALVLGKTLGKDTEDPKELFKFLKTVPAEKLVNVNATILSNEQIPVGIYEMLNFVPVVESNFGQERFLTDEPEKLLHSGKVNTRDIIIGHTSDEAILDLLGFGDVIFENYPLKPELLVPRKILLKKAPPEVMELSDKIKKQYFGAKPINSNSVKELLNLLNDVFYFNDVYRYVELFHHIPNSNVYLYRFSAVAGRNIYGLQAAKYNITGAAHFDDMSYLFDVKLASFTVDKNSKEYKIITNISKMYTNFAKQGNPTPKGDFSVTWPTYTNVTKAYLDISEQLIVGKELDKNVDAFWRKLYTDAGIRYDLFDKLYSQN